MAKEWFEYNYGDTTKILNIYGLICTELPRLDSPHYFFKKENKEPAERLLELLNQFEMYVPEEIRNNLTIKPNKIKKRCLEVLTELKEIE
jgi:hypothetical protein